MKTYNQYCPMAHALDLVGERWSLLIVRELLEEGPLRYTDLHVRLDGCGTNILAARLKELERGGIVRKRRLPPPAASTVYELTEYGEGLRAVLHQLAHWGARSLGPPPAEAVEPGWLPGTLRIALPPVDDCIEFRIDGEIAHLSGTTAVPGSASAPDAVVEGSVSGFYHLLVDRDLDGIAISGSRAAVEAMLAKLPPLVANPAAEPAAA
jgi:DNA-binding HxlR family transcriptional regulator